MLHRLDHSIHTMRLWGNTKAKELSSDWNMNMLFRLVHNDMGGICLERLNEIRAPGNDAKHFTPEYIMNECELKFNVIEWQTAPLCL